MQRKRTYRKNVESIINLAVRSLLKSGFYEWLTPLPEAVMLASKLRILGYRDNIDNMLYATSVDSDLLLLTMDYDLRGFL